MTHMMAVLNALAQPAFFLKDGKVSRCNEACARLPLKVGDAVPALEEFPLRGDTLHAACRVFEQDWELTVLPMDGEHLVLLKAQEEETAQLNLLDAAARGFRQPLTAVATAGSTLFAQLESLEDEELQAGASALARGIFRTLRNLNAMTEYSRLLRSEVPLHVEKTQIKNFFGELADLWADILLDSGIVLQYHAPQNEFNANLDRTLVQRAVLALLSNAAAWGQPGDPISLAVSYLGNRMKIVVKNTGKAMDAEVFATAFSRYEHVSPLDDSRWGAGFGLPLARLIAQKHGGSIFLESNDSGTAVTMTLDLHTPLSTGLRTPTADPMSHYDPAMVEFSGILPDATYDSRNVDL